LAATMSAELGRAILIVLDSVGCGAAEDAKAYGDEGADTLGHIAEACADGRGDREGVRRGPLMLPQLAALGLGHAMKASTGHAPPGFALAESRGQWG
jgi:phosphopentomutase